jgi:hypothetical protein
MRPLLISLFWLFAGSALHAATGTAVDGGFTIDTLELPAIVAPTTSLTSATGATLSAEVTSDGGVGIIERGFVYSTIAINADPLIDGTGVSRVRVAGTTGVFSTAVTGLNQGIGYSFRAYATNSRGTAYSSVATFSTVVSSNADLSFLTPGTGALSPGFASGTTTYGGVTTPAAFITFTPTSAQASATIEIRVNGLAFAVVNSGTPSAPLPLNQGANAVDVRVTAQDGVTQKTYNIAVTRAATPIVTTPTVTDPTVALRNPTGATLGANVTSDGNAAIIERGIVYSVAAINPNPLIGGPSVTKVEVPGTTGPLTIAVTGLSQLTGYNFKAYAINSQGISYSPLGAFSTVSNNSNLSALTLEGFVFSPAFVASTTRYSATVQRADGTVRLRPISADAGATISARVNGGGWLAVVSGSPSPPLTLEFGDNLVEVRVIAEDGSTQQIYTMDVFRNKEQPDMLVGNSLGLMLGGNVFTGALSQKLEVTSQKAAPVSAFVSVINRGNRPDRFDFRGTGDTRYFKIDYRDANFALVSAAVKAGLYRTSQMEPEAPGEWLQVTVTPVKKLIVVKKGKKTVTLRKVRNSIINATSVLNPAIVDGVSIEVETR